VTVKRSTLCQVEGSMMAAMFSGHHDDKLDSDKSGNVFLSYPPQVMLPLMDWLTTNLVLPPGAKRSKIDMPSEYMDMWGSVLEFFGLEKVVYPPMVFSGIKTNFKMSNLAGWEVVVCKPYSDETSLEDFQLPGVPEDSAVLVRARKAGADELLLAAMGRLDVITANKALNATQLHNGAYWYCTAGKSIGFAPDATVCMDNADSHDRESLCRMSWNLNKRGSYRAGSHVKLWESKGFEKIMMRPCRAAMMSTGFPVVLETLLR